LNELKSQGEKVTTAASLDCILLALLVISIVINCSTLGSPLRDKKKKVVNRKVYGRLDERPTD